MSASTAPHDRANYFRQRAEETEARAAECQNEETADRFRELAKQWRLMLKSAEQTNH